jgi:uncharacterized membrane protein
MSVGSRRGRLVPQWLLPLGYTVIAVGCAYVLPRIEHAVAWHIELGISTNAALVVLSAIASGTMGLTAIVFSIAFVMMQFSAVTYSPRVALRFARDPLIFHALGVFFATFTYAMAAAAWVDRDGSGHVPSLSWLFALGLLILSLVLFTALVQRLQSLQITDTLRSLGDSGREVIAQTYPSGRLRRVSLRDSPLASAPVSRVVRYAGPPRHITSIDIATLVGLARRSDGLVALASAVGDTMFDGRVLIRVHGAASPVPEADLLGAVHFGLERTAEQDPKYPIRLLVDVAIKALSPAINDPTTAVQAIDQIEDLLLRLARVQLDDGAEADAQGVLRLTFPMPSWDDYLSLAFDEIRMFGATSIQVLRRLRSALTGLLEVLGDDPRAGVVRAYLQHMDAMVAASAFDEMDRRRAGQKDPQGLGLAREN